MKSRLPSKRIYLSELEHGHYVEKEGDFDPNYILTQDGEKLYRAKVVATIVAGPYFSDDNSYARVLLDDTTGTVWASAFREEAQLLKNLHHGDIVQLIARPREWQGIKQLTIEVVSIVTPAFMLLARAEILRRKLMQKGNLVQARSLLEEAGSVRQARELAEERGLDPDIVESIDELEYYEEKEKDEMVDSNKLDLVKNKIVEKLQDLQGEEDGVELDVLIAELVPEFTAAEVEEGVKSLLALGDLFEPKVGYYMLA